MRTPTCSAATVAILLIVVMSAGSTWSAEI